MDAFAARGGPVVQRLHRGEILIGSDRRQDTDAHQEAR